MNKLIYLSLLAISISSSAITFAIASEAPPEVAEEATRLGRLGSLTACGSVTYTFEEVGGGKCKLNGLGPYDVWILPEFDDCLDVTFEASYPILAVPGNGSEEGLTNKCPEYRNPGSGTDKVVNASYDPPPRKADPNYRCTHSFVLNSTLSCYIKITVKPQ